MATVLRRAARIATFALVCVGNVRGEQPAKTSSLPSSEIRRHLVALVSGDLKKTPAARAALEALPAHARKPVFDLLRSLPFTPPSGWQPPAKKRSFLHTIDLPESPAGKGEAWISLPKDYNGKKPVPVLFQFHGTGDTAESFRDACTEAPKTNEFLIVTPQIPSQDRHSWRDPGAFALTDKLMAFVRQHFNVDPDRVYFSGFSAGGAASFFFSQIWPDQVAGFYSVGRLWWACNEMPEPCMDSLQSIPGYFVIGLDDKPDRVDGFRTAEAYYKLRKLPGEFNFLKGRGHEFMPEHHVKAIDYMLKHKRSRDPKEIRGIFHLYSNESETEPLSRKRWWLEATEYDRKGTVFTANIQGQTISIDAPGLRRGAVWLNDTLLDLDQPVVILLNGNEVHRAAVDRSIPFLLDHFLRHRDAGGMYWNRIAF